MDGALTWLFYLISVIGTVSSIIALIQSEKRNNVSSWKIFSGADIILAKTILSTHRISGKVFGVKIFSIRALFVSALISLFSFFLAVLGASVFGIKMEWIRDFFIIPITKDSTILVPLIFMLLACVITDYFSVCQTRILISKIKISYKTATILLFLISDLILTTIIFIMSFFIVGMFTIIGIALSENYFSTSLLHINFILNFGEYFTSVMNLMLSHFGPCCEGWQLMSFYVNDPSGNELQKIWYPFTGWWITTYVTSMWILLYISTIIICRYLALNILVMQTAFINVYQRPFLLMKYVLMPFTFLSMGMILYHLVAENWNF